MFVPSLERIGSSSQIKDTKHHFFLKMAKYPCLNSPERAIVYTDETWLNQGHCTKKEWVDLETLKEKTLDLCV